MRIFAPPGEHVHDLFWRQTGQNRQTAAVHNPSAPLPVPTHVLILDTISQLLYTHADIPVRTVAMRDEREEIPMTAQHAARWMECPRIFHTDLNT